MQIFEYHTVSGIKKGNMFIDRIRKITIRYATIYESFLV